ncbi:hypothetical protein DEIPH_ctg011orf0011 [Deinococcus phoenicis]|uniref:Uncharacterized protein n=1 Tax=Deinococcus phoenicis TaxID=1476583 RepID=A0A016QT69_9DEIO|nr:hypothetical protein [Deinococcus phoenicis]EYB69047.1 hypothetical protein DEIPH_ctg011orf0011 [Deinococcus phoenicis]
MIGLDCVRAGGVLRVGLLLCDGAIPAQDAPARFFDADNKETLLTVRLPELQDAMYEAVELEIVNASNP